VVVGLDTGALVVSSVGAGARTVLLVGCEFEEDLAAAAEAPTRSARIAAALGIFPIPQRHRASLRSAGGELEAARRSAAAWEAAVVEVRPASPA